MPSWISSRRRVRRRGAAGRRRPSAGRGCRSRTGPRRASRNDGCNASRVAVVRQPSTVATSPPSASTASTRHESTIRPFNRTVHAPHSPTRQHSLVPVRPRSSRSDVEQRVVRGDGDGSMPSPLSAARCRSCRQPFARCRQGPLGQHAQHGQPVVGPGAHRGRRWRGCGKARLDGISVNEQQRPRAEAAKGEARRSRAHPRSPRASRRRGRDRAVECVARMPTRLARVGMGSEIGDQLACRKRGHTGSDEEVIERQLAGRRTGPRSSGAPRR